MASIVWPWWPIRSPRSSPTNSAVTPSGSSTSRTDASTPIPVTICSRISFTHAAGFVESVAKALSLAQLDLIAHQRRRPERFFFLRGGGGGGPSRRGLLVAPTPLGSLRCAGLARPRNRPLRPLPASPSPLATWRSRGLLSTDE